MTRLYSLLLFLVLTVPAHAETVAMCSAESVLDKHQFLRRLSLDLRGRVPTYEEYLALDATPDVPGASIDAFLLDDGFRQQMRRYHESIFWPNISAVRLVGNTSTIAHPTGFYFGINPAKQIRFRGITNLVTADGMQCGDYEQTHFLPGNSYFQPDPAFIRTTPEGYRQEGWRMVTPYWSTTPVKVCAYDAQETPEATLSRGRVVSCGTPDGGFSALCGCGANLRFCYPSSPSVETVIRNSLREQMGRALDEVTVGGKPYTSLLLSTAADENGPIAFWRKYLSQNYTYNLTFNVPDAAEEIPDKAFTDTTWTRIDRGPFHAGVSTLPAYLLRFQTNRGRANRARIAFECETFVPPASLTASPGCSNSTDDLTQRCGCQYCHQTLEPLAAYFGQFTEAGTTLMSDTSTFPRFLEACVTSTPSAFCRRFYATDASAERPGYLLPYQFAALHTDVTTNLLNGPRARAQSILQTGALSRCTVRRVFAHLVRRDLRTVGEDTSELELFNTLDAEFRASNYDFPRLVRRIVSLPAYRRVQP